MSALTFKFKPFSAQNDDIFDRWDFTGVITRLRLRAQAAISTADARVLYFD